MTRRARKGSGHLYRRSRVWWIKWTDATGKAHFRSSGTADRAVAATMLREQVAHRDRGMPVLPDPRRLFIETLLDNLMTEYRANGRRSIDRVDLSRRHLLHYFRGHSAASVTGADIPRYADRRLNEKASPATINRELAALRRAFSLAVRQGLLLVAPSIPALREDNVRTGFFEPEQFAAVCGRLGEVEADIARFCYHTGWRSRSEVYPLTWAQVDWAGGLIRLEPGTTKNRDGRSFPITPALRTVLERRLDFTRRCERSQGRIIPWVFHRKGQPVKTMAKSWQTACTNAGVPGRFLHDLRRTAVRNLERAGVSRSVAMKMTGHKTESVYRRYAIVSESDLREAGAKLAALGPHVGQMRS